MSAQSLSRDMSKEMYEWKKKPVNERLVCRRIPVMCRHNLPRIVTCANESCHMYR